MPGPDEITPLLGRIVEGGENGHDTAPNHQNYSTSTESEESAIEETDESVNVFMSEHGGPTTSLGLSGGMDLFGTSFIRRSSIAFEKDGSEVTERYRRRSSVAFPGGRRRPSVQDPTFLQRERRKSVIKITTAPISEHLEDADPTKGPKYLYNVSEAQFRWIFVGMLLTWFVASFDSTLMASSHPVITSYFDASNYAAWLSTSFLLTSTAFQPMFGRISDTVGRKSPFVFCMIMFTLGTALCGLAQSIMQFICARALCGLGAGGAMALGAIIVADLIPLHRRAPYLAILNLGNGIATSLGAALGGFLADALGWRWEFGIQIPALILCTLSTAFFLPAKLGPCLIDTEKKTFWQTMKEFDLTGSLFLTISVTCLILGLNLGGNVLPWTHPVIIGNLILALLLAIAFVYTEHRVAKPIMPLGLLTNIPSVNLILSNFFGCITMNNILFNVPLYFQGILLDTATRSGTRLIIPFFLGMAASFATGWIIHGTQRVTPSMIVGAVLIVAGTTALTFMPRTLPDLTYSWLIALTTVGQGINFPTYSIGLLAVTPPEDIAVAMSTLFLFRNLGNVLGVAISSLVSQNALLHYLDKMLTGEDAMETIHKVRQSVQAIGHLMPEAREQVIEAYAATMRLTFGQGAISAAIALILVIGIRLPRLSAVPQQMIHGE